MELFSTPVVPASTDAFWELPAADAIPPGCRMLVVTRPFGKGSPAATTLSKMMDACRLRLEEYAIFELPEGEMLSWSLLRGQTDAQFVLLLGVSPAELGISALFAFNRPNHFGGAQFIPGLAPDQLVQDAASRGELWKEGLKPAFGL